MFRWKSVLPTPWNVTCGYLTSKYSFRRNGDHIPAFQNRKRFRYPNNASQGNKVQQPLRDARPPLAGILEGQWFNHGRLSTLEANPLILTLQSFGRWWKISSGFRWITSPKAKAWHRPKDSPVQRHSHLCKRPYPSSTS